MDNIQAVLDRLGASNPQLAGEVRNALTAMAAERDQATARANAAEAKAHDLAVERAMAKLGGAGQKVQYQYQPPEPQKVMLREDFDKLDHLQKYNAIMKDRVKIVS